MPYPEEDIIESFKDCGLCPSVQELNVLKRHVHNEHQRNRRELKTMIALIKSSTGFLIRQAIEKELSAHADFGGLADYVADLVVKRQKDTRFYNRMIKWIKEKKHGWRIKIKTICERRSQADG